MYIYISQTNLFYSIFFFSLGIVLTQGHGEYIFKGNVSVEEGKYVHVYPSPWFYVSLSLVTCFGVFIFSTFFKVSMT